MSAPDSLDEAFARHFRAVTPREWPGPPASALSEPERQRGREGNPRWRSGSDPLVRSRLALAVAAAVLLGLGMLVSRPPGPPPTAADPLLQAAEASGANLPKPPMPMP